MSDGAALIDLGGGSSNVTQPSAISTAETIAMVRDDGQVRVTVPEEIMQTQQNPVAKSSGMGIIWKVLLGLAALGIFGVLALAVGIFIYSAKKDPEKVMNAVSKSNSNGSFTSSSTPAVTADEKPKISSTQQSIIDGGTETKWDDQGLSWKLPSGWKKMEVKKEMFNYQSLDNAFLLVNISVMPDSFPMDVSQNAYYEQAMQQLKNGKYESVKMVEIDGITGVEFTEAAPEEKDGIRRHQWIAYRTYLGQKQMLNVMTTTKASNFTTHQDDFAAILYSMKAVK